MQKKIILITFYISVFNINVDKTYANVATPNDTNVNVESETTNKNDNKKNNNIEKKNDGTKKITANITKKNQMKQNIQKTPKKKGVKNELLTDEDGTIVSKKSSTDLNNNTIESYKEKVVLVENENNTQQPEDEKKKDKAEKERLKQEKLENERAEAKKNKIQQRQDLMNLQLSKEQIESEISLYNIMRNFIANDFVNEDKINELSMHINKNKIIFKTKYTHQLIFDALQIQNKTLALSAIKMLREKGIDIDFQDEQSGLTPLMMAIGMEDTKEIIQLLLDSGLVDLTIKDKKGETSLIKAIIAKKPDIVKNILNIDKHKDTLLITNLQNQTPFIIAINMQNDEIFSLIFNNDKKFIISKLKDKNGVTPLMYAVMKSHYKFIKEFLKIDDFFLETVQELSNDNKSIFSVAAERLDFATLDLLINKAKDPKTIEIFEKINNVIEDNGFTPILHLMINANKYKVSLQKNINNKNDSYYTQKLNEFNKKYERILAKIDKISNPLKKTEEKTENNQQTNKNIVNEKEINAFDTFFNIIKSFFTNIINAF